MKRLVLGVLILSVACSKTAMEEPSQPAAPQAVASVETPDEPLPAAEPPKPEPPPEPEPPEDPVPDADPDDMEVPPKEAAAYVADCSHTFKVVNGEDQSIEDECTFLEFDQMCSPDASGCWDKQQLCDSACGPGCTACDEKCAPACDTCKAACKPGDKSCVTACADKRFACNGRCMTRKEKCLGKCQKTYSACEDKHMAKVHRVCDCQGVEDCLQANNEADDPWAICEKKLKPSKKKCLEWCQY